MTWPLQIKSRLHAWPGARGQGPGGPAGGSRPRRAAAALACLPHCAPPWPVVATRGSRTADPLRTCAQGEGDHQKRGSHWGGRAGCRARQTRPSTRARGAARARAAEHRAAACPGKAGPSGRQAAPCAPERAGPHPNWTEPKLAVCSCTGRRPHRRVALGPRRCGPRRPAVLLCPRGSAGPAEPPARGPNAGLPCRPSARPDPPGQRARRTPPRGVPRVAAWPRLRCGNGRRSATHRPGAARRRRPAPVHAQVCSGNC